MHTHTHGCREREAERDIYHVFDFVMLFCCLSPYALVNHASCLCNVCFICTLRSFSEFQSWKLRMEVPPEMSACLILWLWLCPSSLLLAVLSLAMLSGHHVVVKWFVIPPYEWTISNCICIILLWWLITHNAFNLVIILTEFWHSIQMEYSISY